MRRTSQRMRRASGPFAESSTSSYAAASGVVMRIQVTGDATTGWMAHGVPDIERLEAGELESPFR